MGETFYDVLGVGPDASQDEIQAAYRERVKATHPDLNDAPDASDAFQRVQTAEEVLGDPDERARYDRLGHRSYTSHFARAGNGTRSASDDGNAARWDVGTDREADDVRDDHGFGFDPGAYDRTRSTGDSGNPSERSYDVSGGTDPTDGDDETTGTAGSASGSATAGGANASSGSATASTRDASWRERARATERRWTKATQREGRGSNDEDGGGYSVHDWNDDELQTERNRYRLQGSEAVVVGILFVLYPFMAYSAVTPQFSLFVNVTVALCALALTGYLLTMPRIGFYVFGAWSVIAPLAMLGVSGFEAISLVGLVVLGATWIPFGYSVLFLIVLR